MLSGRLCFVFARTQSRASIGGSFRVRSARPSAARLRIL
jgi:hypothetical protein